MNPQAATVSPVMLIPYFGPWPEYFPLFLDGCRRNPGFRVIFFTDGAPPAACPPSVRFVRMTMDELRVLASSRLGTDVALRHPYKLCDLKPAYGEIFKEWIGDSAFWGFGDIDLVYGDLGRFASQEVLRHYDIFCVRKEYVSGSFTLVRNSPRMNGLFRGSRDWQKIMGNEAYGGFDECASRWGDLIFGASIEDLHMEVCTFTEVVFRAMKQQEIKGYFETVTLEDIHSSIMVNDKGVFENYTGYAMFHFVIAKHRLFFCVPDWAPIPRTYYVTRRGFFRDEDKKWFRRAFAIPYGKVLARAWAKSRRKARRLLAGSKGTGTA